MVVSKHGPRENKKSLLLDLTPAGSVDFTKTNSRANSAVGCTLDDRAIDLVIITRVS